MAERSLQNQIQILQPLCFFRVPVVYALKPCDNEGGIIVHRRFTSITAPAFSDISQNEYLARPGVNAHPRENSNILTG